MPAAPREPWLQILHVVCKMITRTFTGPTGSGLRARLVAPLAMAQRGKKIVVLSQYNEMMRQMQRMVPGSYVFNIERVRVHKMTFDKDVLVIADTVNERYMDLLEDIGCDVWWVEAPMAALKLKHCQHYSMNGFACGTVFDHVLGGNANVDN